MSDLTWREIADALTEKSGVRWFDITVQQALADLTRKRRPDLTWGQIANALNERSGAPGLWCEETVQKAFVDLTLMRLRDAGSTSREIAETLMAMRIPPTSGLRWFPETVQKALAVLPAPDAQRPLRDAWLDWLDGERLALFGTLTLKQGIPLKGDPHRLQDFVPITPGDIPATAAKFRNTFTRKIYGSSAKHRPFLMFHHCARDDAAEGSIHKRHHLHFVCEKPDMSFAEISARFVRSTDEPSLPWLYNEHDLTEITPGTAREVLGYSLDDGRSRALTIGDAFLPEASRVPTLVRNENR